MRISALLQAKGATVHTVRRDATVAEVVALLSRHDVGALVVSDDGVHIEGIVSERDVVRRLHELRGALMVEQVSVIMSRDVTTCSPEDEVESLMSTMTDRRVRHVPVVSGGELVGIVSIGDVVKHTIEQLELDRKLLEDYITAR